MRIEVKAGGVHIGGGRQMVLITGPCVIEGSHFTLDVAHSLKEITDKAGIPFIFKSSYDKANRTNIKSARGPGMDEGLEILARVKEEVKVPVTSDVHSAPEAKKSGAVLDLIQIPALLCRQTDILVSAASTGKPVNIKKGQFLSPYDMRNAAEKVLSVRGNGGVVLTERGTTFGYNNLVTDLRSLEIMRSFGCPVIFDASHSVQTPGGQGKSSGGENRFIPLLSRAAAAAGIDGLFIEVHPNPAKALCDGPNSLKLSLLPGLLSVVKEIDMIVKKTSSAESQHERKKRR